jgi:hypothetical protein
VGKPNGYRPLGRPRRRLVDNIKMDIRHRMGWYELGRSGSDRDQWRTLVNPVKDLKVL